MNTRLQKAIEANREQLLERIHPDEVFVHSHWNSQRSLVAFIPPSAQTILDLGCGNTSDMLMHVPDMIYLGLDIVPEYLQNLRRVNSEIGPFSFSRRWWVQAPMESLPLPDESFDVVYSRHALEHSIDLEASLHEIKRVLKPGGLFLFCVPARVDDGEPTHLTRWPARQWLQAFRIVGKIRYHAQHDYFVDELYGYAQKPGQSHLTLIQSAKRLGKYLLGQGILPMWSKNTLARIYRFADQVAARDLN
jgi:ubiquinone/menaquinone biosynthesis C-methylase UbiE